MRRRRARHVERKKRGRFVSRWWRDAGAIAAVMRENDRLLGVGFGAPEAIQDSCKNNRRTAAADACFRDFFRDPTRHPSARCTICMFFQSGFFDGRAAFFDALATCTVIARQAAPFSLRSRSGVGSSPRHTPPTPARSREEHAVRPPPHRARRLLERRNSRRLFPGARTRIAHARRGPAENPDARDGWNHRRHHQPERQGHAVRGPRRDRGEGRGDRGRPRGEPGEVPLRQDRHVQHRQPAEPRAEAHHLLPPGSRALRLPRGAPRDRPEDRPGFAARAAPRRRAPDARHPRERARRPPDPPSSRPPPRLAPRSDASLFGTTRTRAAPPRTPA